MADVFISYRKADRGKAEALAKALKVENLDVWWDAGLETGQTFDEKIQAVLEQVKAVIVIWSKESVKSEWVRAESSVGRERGILVPVMIQSVNIPVPFNLLQTADLIGWNGDRSHPGYQDVVKQVKELAGKQDVRPLKPPPNRQIRALWRAVTVIGVVAVVGASTWLLQPWKYLDPDFRAAEAAAATKAKVEASREKLAPFGVLLADFETYTGWEIANRRFKPETFPQLKALADTGEPAALALLCAVLQERTVPGPNVNQEQAADVCPKASEAGEPAGHLYNGDFLADAGVYDGTIDEDKTALAATAEYRAAADAGSSWGAIEYGRRLRGGEGVAADPIAAEKYFKQAKATGLAAADYWLGDLYMSGDIAGPAADDAIAMVKKAAAAGYAPAQFDLCNNLIGGVGWGDDLEAALANCKAAMSSIDPKIAVKAEGYIPDVERRIKERDAAKAGQPSPT